MSTYDVVVAGAGVAGLHAAYILAREGFNVAIVEMKKEGSIGDKVCGDAIGEHHFKNVGLEEPRVGVDATGVFEGVRVFSPSKKHYVTAVGRGFALDRRAFGQRLLRMAVNAGVAVHPSTVAIKPMVEGSWVRGLVARTEGGTLELRAKAVVDATGTAAAVRSRLPSEWWISYRAPLEDFNSAYRLICAVETLLDVKYANIYLDEAVAPGGYWWLFPKDEKTVNVGLGVKAGVPGVNPQKNFRSLVLPQIPVARVYHEGGGVVPTRRPLPCMVGNGVLAVGDAAYTANPIHGGGIGPALLSSFHAAHTLARALGGEGEASISALWPYQIAYHKAYGAKQASLDILRLFLQRMTNEDLEYVISKRLVSDEELSEMGYKGHLPGRVIRRVLAAARLLDRPSILVNLLKVKRAMDRAYELYLDFPESPQGFPAWVQREESLFNSFKQWCGSVG